MCSSPIGIRRCYSPAALWTSGTSEIETSRERIAASIVGVKPVQNPHPPILLAPYNPAGLDRIARRADGWLPFGVPLDDIWGAER